jgi:hypothetical protein
MLNPDDTPALRLAPYNKVVNGRGKDATCLSGVACNEIKIVAASRSLHGADINLQKA